MSSPTSPNTEALLRARALLRDPDLAHDVAQLASIAWRDGKTESTAIGPPVEVELRAGEVTRVLLQQW